MRSPGDEIRVEFAYFGQHRQSADSGRDKESPGSTSLHEQKGRGAGCHEKDALQHPKQPWTVTRNDHRSDNTRQGKQCCQNSQAQVSHPSGRPGQNHKGGRQKDELNKKVHSKPIQKIFRTEGQDLSPRRSAGRNVNPCAESTRPRWLRL
jgi:hypothetical protein